MILSTSARAGNIALQETVTKIMPKMKQRIAVKLRGINQNNRIRWSISRVELWRIVALVDFFRHFRTLFYHRFWHEMRLNFYIGSTSWIAFTNNSDEILGRLHGKSATH